MPHQILTGNDPRLRAKAREVSKDEIASPLFQELADDLTVLMERHDGIGLAAPQVGISKRVIAVTLGWRTRCLVNPTITWKSQQTELGEEGCLSFPGLFGMVERPREVHVEALDTSGKPVQLKLKGLDARVVQHEMDHLDGVLLPDRLVAPEHSKVPVAATTRGRAF
jgi:peptide deformylase